MKWDLPNYKLYLLLGIIIWSYFAEATAIGLMSLMNKSSIITKIYFPRIIIIIASTITALLTFLLNMLIFFVFVWICRHLWFQWFLTTLPFENVFLAIPRISNLEYIFNMFCWLRFKFVFYRILWFFWNHVKLHLAPFLRNKPFRKSLQKKETPYLKFKDYHRVRWLPETPPLIILYKGRRLAGALSRQ